MQTGNANRHFIEKLIKVIKRLLERFVMPFTFFFFPEVVGLVCYIMTSCSGYNCHHRGL